MCGQLGSSGGRGRESWVDVKFCIFAGGGFTKIKQMQTRGGGVQVLVIL